MTDSTGRAGEDAIGRTLDDWGQVVPEAFHRIEAAARLEQLANVLADAMDRVAVEESLINQGDYQVLSVLRLAHHRGESRTSVEVARQLKMTPATMVNRVDRLERLGYVERVPHPLDRRAAHLVITPEGKACAERMVLRRTEERERYLSALTDSQRTRLAALLRRLSSAWM